MKTKRNRIKKAAFKSNYITRKVFEKENKNEALVKLEALFS